VSKIIVGARSDGIYEALHAAGVFADDPKDVRRVVIDLEAGSAARVYVERFVDDSLIDVLMRGEIEIVEREKAER
jgi:hypothetical protein